MGRLWTPEARFGFMLEVEKAVAETQARFKLIPSAAARAIKSKARFNIDRIHEIEKTTKHDVIAFVSSVAESVGLQGRFVHYGLTSSDVLDTALSLQIRAAGELITAGLERLEKQLFQLAKRHRLTLTAGRTHGMHAEPTSFGYKLLGHLHEIKRSHDRWSLALKRITIGKLSGAVGTYSALSLEIEKDVCRRLKLNQEQVATQVIPRDRHAEVIISLAFIGSALERLALEMRHLQRTEVGEVVEGFTPGQKGSSAMPHKKNPISGENLTGIARLLRSYVAPALENVSLWHERDISHSSVERVILPDAFILCDYALDRMVQLLKGLFVDKQRMLKNMEISSGQLYSSHLLLALVQKGLSREEAYALTQKASHSLKPGQSLLQVTAKHPEITSRLKQSELKAIFSGQHHRKQLAAAFDRAAKGLK